MFLFYYNTTTLIFQYLYVFLHKIHKQIGTNIKTSLQAATVAVDSIRNISAGAYIGSDGLFDTATLAAYKQQLEGLTVTQQKMALMTTNLTAAQREQVLSYIASTTATKTLTTEQVLSCTADEKRILVKAGLIAEEELEKGAVINLTQEKLKEILADETLNATEKNTILTKFGVTGANLTEASSWEVLGKSIGKATIEMMKWLFLTPAGWATLAIGAVVGLIGAYAKWGPTLENTREKLENLKSECETLASDLSSVNSELETTKQRINELEGKESLTFVEAEELENLKKQNNELERTIDLLELEQKTKNKEKNKTFVDTMEKDVYSTDYYKDGLDGGKIKKGQAGRSEHRTTTTEQAYIIQQFNDREKLLDDLTNAETEAERKRIQEQIDKIDKYLSDRNDQFKSDAEGIDYIQNPTNEDDKKVNEWLDYINDFQDKMAIAMGGDNAKENAFNRLVDNWKFDELLNPLQKLGKEGKVTLDDLKSRMSDPVFSEFVNKLVEIGFISDTTDGSLRYLANAFNGTATSARNYVTALKGNDLNNFIDNLGEEAKALGTTESELAKLTAAHVIFNNTGLSTEQQQRALQALAQKIATTSSEMKYLLRLFNIASMDSVDELVAQGRTRHEALRQQANVRKYLKDKYGIDLSPIEIPEKEDIVPYTPPGDKDKGKDNTPDYEDPTDAIINRINLRADELAQQEEEIQNLIEIAELENDYKKQISSTNDLITTRKKRVDELNVANSELHQMAEDLRNNTPQWNEEEWFDSLGNATEAYNTLYNNSSKEEQEKLKTHFEKISKIKEAWVANDEELIELNKQLLQDAENLNDIYETIANTTIDSINHQIDLNINNYGEDFNNNAYYKQIQEIAHAEAERLRALDPEKYKEQIREWQNVWWDAQNEMLDYNESVIDDFLNELQEKLDKEYDIRISRLNSESSLLSSHYGVLNAINEEQHNLNKELREAETIGARMNEQERETLFTKKEHTRLTGKLKEVMDGINVLQHNYQHDLETATEDTIEEITNNYERQYELKMKEYEIVRAELDLMKAQQVLENTENEKSVRTWNGSSWVYEANLQDVLDAQEELANAEYELEKAKIEEIQKHELNALDANADALQTEKNRLATAIDEMAEKMEGSGKRITDMLKTIAETDLPTFDAIIQELGGSLKEAFGITDEDINKYRTSSMAGRGGASGLSSEYVSWAKSQMEANGKAWHSADADGKVALEKANQSLGAVIGSTYDEVSGTWKHKYASGTKNARRGLGLFDEDGLGSEFISTKDGVLTQFQGGEHVFSPEMADRLWEMAQQNYTFTPVITQPDFGKLIPIEDKINNAINNISNAFGDTYMIKDVQLNESEGGTLKGFMNFLKKKI